MIAPEVDVHAIAAAAPLPFVFEQVSTEDRMQAMHAYRPLGEIVAELTPVMPGMPIGQRFWHPARIARAVINSNIAGPERVALVNETTAFAMEVYAGTAEERRLTAIRQALRGYRLLPRYVEQTYDATTAAATIPTLSEIAAERLLEKTDDPLLFIPLCHGGFVAAIEGALFHSRMGGNPLSTIYPVRHSRSKSMDRKPRIATAEMLHIRALAKDRTVVLYDDDGTTGKTIRRTIDFFRDRDLACNGMLAVVNSDRRSLARQRRQGEWWENV